MRRSHRKSRLGCPECKKRHIKCDEHRPSCVNCSTAGMTCSFAPVHAHVDGQNEVRPSKSTPSITAPSSESTTPVAAPETITSAKLPYVNTTHLELFYSAMSGREWAFGDQDQLATRHVVLEHAMKEPFLLHEILAVSALHLSTQRSTQQYMYREEAARLQSEASRLFSASVVDLNVHNIIPAFIFSGLHGIASFFETFHRPIPQTGIGKNNWTSLEKIVQSLRILQGVQIIIHGWWEYLTTSEIQGILKEDISTPNVDWEDSNTAKLAEFRTFIENSQGMNESQIAVCAAAINDLILVYKSAFENEASNLPNQAATKYVIQWFVKVSPSYTELLVQEQPQALAVLGYFAVILHKLRHCWVAGEAAEKLLLVVDSHLDSLWRKAIAWPKSFVQDACVTASTDSIEVYQA